MCPGKCILYQKMKWENMRDYKSIDSNFVGLRTSLLKMSEAEVRDLKRFWDDLSWWERDDSLKSAINFLDNCGYEELPVDLQIRRNNIIDDIKKLSDLNNKGVSIKLEKIIGRYTNLGNKSCKPNFRLCLNIIPRLSNKELDDFDRYLGIDEDVKKNGRSIDLYWAVGADQSLSLFYAFRNYLGKFMRK